MRQRWNHIFFIHSKVDPVALQRHVPFELDLIEGNALLSIVPFQMDKICFLGVPPLPFFSHLWELNLRTYVTLGGERGVYFFTLDTDSRLGCFVANRFFHLPYRVSEIKASVSKERYQFQSYRPPFSFSLQFQFSGKKKSLTPLNQWATQRDRLFVRKGKKVYEGRVLHKEWPLEEVYNISIKDHFSTQLPLLCNFDHQEACYARQLEVEFLPFRQLSI